MSATWTPHSRAFETSLASLAHWRNETAARLAALRRWATAGRLIDEQAAARLSHLEQRLSHERLTIAFVAEQSRGKSELINALFFAEQGARLLPASGGKIICPVEILWDSSRKPSIRLLPIETRDTTRALRDYHKSLEEWHEVPLDPGKPGTLAAACEALTQFK